MNFISELKRRNVIRMAGLYLVGAWLITQVAGTVLPMFGAPAWVPRTIVIVLAIGFIPALAFAWIFELTPDGIKRDEDVPKGKSIAPQTAQRMNRMIVAVLVLALGYFAVDKFVLAPKRVPSQAPVASAVAVAADNSIAVLPFVNMSSDKEQEYFSDGLSEELLNLLAQLPQMRVIARTSSFSFKGKEVDVATIAKALNVANVLEGSVRKSGNTLRITAQLIRTSDSSHLWSQTYDRELTDVFKVQDEIAAAVVSALQVQLLPNQALTNQHQSDNPEAYNQYLLGNQFYNRQNPEDWRRAVEAYKQAIALDPKYAAAYAGLASAQGFLADNVGDRVAMQVSIASADKAIALAPGLADGYISRGIARLSHNKDWAGARADLEKALALNASDSRVQIGYGRLLIALGQVPEAVAATRKAVDLDPLSSVAWAQLGRMLTASGQLPEAEKALGRTLEISPESEYALFHMGELQLLEGLPQEALLSFKKAGTYGPAGMAMAEYSLGHAKESQQALDEQIARYSQGAAYQIGEIYAWRGEKDKAFEWLDRAYAQHDGGLTFIKNDPLLAKLRDDPRYATLLRKLGLPTP